MHSIGLSVSYKGTIFEGCIEWDGQTTDDDPDLSEDRITHVELTLEERPGRTQWPTTRLPELSDSALEEVTDLLKAQVDRYDWDWDWGPYCPRITVTMVREALEKSRNS